MAEYFARNNVFQVDVSRLRHTAAASPQSAPRHSPLGMRICGGGFPTCCRCVSAMHVSPRVVGGVLVIHPRHKQLTVEIEEYASPLFATTSTVVRPLRIRFCADDSPRRERERERERESLGSPLLAIDPPPLVHAGERNKCQSRWSGEEESMRR